MKLKQFMNIFEAKKETSKKTANKPAEQGKNLENIDLKKKEDVGFIKPGNTKKKESAGSLANFKQMGKWNYVKGMLMNLAIPYVSHKWEQSGDIIVQIDPEYCAKNKYKSGKDGVLDKKFYEMIEEAGFRTETVKFTTTEVEDKPKPVITQ
jgi:hypothetical protein